MVGCPHDFSGVDSGRSAGMIEWEVAVSNSWFQLNAGFNFGGGYGFTMPVGFTFRPVNNENTMWEVGFSSRDMITWFRTDHPLVSMVFGFMRIGF